MQRYLDRLNSEQLKPVIQTEGAVLVLAGAGSGKTRVLTTRVAYLIEQLGIVPYNILAITFTNKAANEMKQRVYDMVGNAADMWICTIHSMCVKILRKGIDKLGFDKNFSIYTDQETKTVLKNIISELGIDDKDFVKTVRGHISSAKIENISPEEYETIYNYLDDIENICRVYVKYQDYLRKVNALDFDDILLTALRLLKSDSEIREYYQNKFRYIHIDEFQDTNAVQYEIVKILSGKHGNLFAVGDDDQSIYGWRGANIQNILNFEKDFKNAFVFKLEQNYRSTKNIIECANKVIKHNSARHEKQLWTENEQGVKVEYYQAFNEQEEANYVCRQIRNLLSMGYKNSDIGILMRVNALSFQFEQELLKYGISHKMFGGFKFFERKEVKDILSYFQIVANPFDEQAILRCINTPKRGIGDTLQDKLIEIASLSGVTLYEVIMNIEKYDQISTTQKNKIFGFKAILSKLNELNDTMPLETYINDAVNLTGIRKMYATQTDEDVTKRMNIDQLIMAVEQFCKLNYGATLFDYLQSVTLSSDIDNLDEADNKVTLATIHSVKGLEFKVVFIVGLEDGILPITRSISSGEVEEERRLMYVAITRARERLFLTRAKQRFLYNQRNITLPSRFIKDAVEEVREIKTLEGQYVKLPPKFEPPAPNNVDDFKMGEIIIHKYFGEGVIIGISGTANNKIADIAFKGFGVKKLSLSIAPITKK